MKTKLFSHDLQMHEQAELLLEHEADVASGTHILRMLYPHLMWHAQPGQAVVSEHELQAAMMRQARPAHSKEHGAVGAGVAQLGLEVGCSSREHGAVLPHTALFKFPSHPKKAVLHMASGSRCKSPISQAMHRQDGTESMISLHAHST